MFNSFSYLILGVSAMKLQILGFPGITLKDRLQNLSNKQIMFITGMGW